MKFSKKFSTEFSAKIPSRVRALTLGSGALLLAGGSILSSHAGGESEIIQTLRSIPLVQGYEARDRKEFEIADRLKEIFTKIQDEAAAKDGARARGTHAKGSCFNGSLDILSARELKRSYGYSDALIERLKSGIFSQNSRFPAEIRFANAKGASFPDTARDVRGLAFSVQLNEGYQDFAGARRLDFSTNNTPMFAVNNIQEFHELMKAARLAQGDLSYVPNPLYLPAVKKAKDLLDHYERNDTRSYATEFYWGNLPYTHGLNADGSPKSITKFRLVPCDGSAAQHESSAGKPENYLQKDIQDRALANGVCFAFQVQFFDLQTLRSTSQGSQSRWSQVEWIENGGEHWREEVLPFHTVAKLEIRRELDHEGNVVSRQIPCEGLYVNPRLHSHAANMPIGSISRVRAEVEEHSRHRRASR